MLFDTSTASIISIPVRVTSFSLEPNCGRARPMTMKTSASAKIVNLVRTRFGEASGISPRTVSGSPKRSNARRRTRTEYQ